MEKTKEVERLLTVRRGGGEGGYLWCHMAYMNTNILQSSFESICTEECLNLLVSDDHLSFFASGTCVGIFSCAYW